MGLLLAATNGRTRIVKLLLPSASPLGADSLALQLAVKNGHMEVVRLLLPVSNPNADSFAPLRLAAEYNHLEIAKLLLPLGSLAKVLESQAFMETDVGDFFISNLPTPRARKLAKLYPQIPLPRTRAKLASESLRQRAAASAPAATPRRRT